MSLFDIIVLLIIFLFAIRGLATGMISQIVSVGSYIVSWIISTRFSFLLAPSIPAETPWNNIGAIIILFIVTMIAIRFLHSAIKKIVVKFRLVKYDCFLGLLLGLLKGVLICMVITFFAAMLSEKSRQMILVSKSGNWISQLIVRTGYFIPEDSGKILKAQIELFNEQVDGNFQEQENINLQLPNVSIDNVFDNVQDLRKKIESNIENSTKAVSLIDGINRWWQEWWNGKNNESNESTVKSESNTESNKESELNINPPTNTSNNTDNLFNNNTLKNTKSENQILLQESVPLIEPVLNLVQDVVEPVYSDADSEQLLIPRDRGLFRLSRSPIQPSEFHRSQNTTNNQPAKLFGQ
jgi:uncharacterized membrane protein required for colicin V production